MVDIKRQRRRRRLAFILGAVVAAGGLASPVAATVYEVGDDGNVKAQRSGALAAYAGDAFEYAAPPAPEAAPDIPSAAVTSIAEPSVPPDYRQPLLDASRRYDVSPRLLAALAARESGWRASIVSPKGAIGLTQLMPATARAMDVDPREPSANLAGGARYLRQLIDQFNGNIEQALAAYNAGPGRVVRAMGVPAITETRSYVTNIVDRLGNAVLGDGRQ